MPSSSDGGHPGIIVLRLPEYYVTDRILSAFERFLDSVDMKAIKGSIVSVNPGSYRVRSQR